MKKYKPTAPLFNTSAQRAANPSRTVSTGGWGFEESTDASNSQAGFDFSDLEAALDAMSSKTTPPPPPLSSKSTSSQSAGKSEYKNDGAADKGVVDATVPSLPGFYLDMSEENLERRFFTVTTEETILLLLLLLLMMKLHI